MIRIFAKRTTKEKVVITCPRDCIGIVMKALQKKYGGEWIYTQDLKVNEIIKFEDDLEYNGYKPGQVNYSSGIEILEL